MKKVRNNILKSGITNGSTRNLTLPTGEPIQWQMWIDAYIWDRKTAFQIHRRLSNDHSYLLITTNQNEKSPCRRSFEF